MEMNDKKYIQALLDKFMDSNTSREEERILKEYFSTTEDIPEEWLGFAVLLGGMARKAYTTRSKRSTTVFPWVAVVAASVICILLIRMAGNTDDKLDIQPLAAVEQPLDSVHRSIVSQPAAGTSVITCQTSSTPRLEAVRQSVQASARARKQNIRKSRPKVENKPTQEEMMRAYVEENFTTLMEHSAREATEEVIAQYRDEQQELRVCMNGIGRMVNIESYE